MLLSPSAAVITDNRPMPGNDNTHKEQAETKNLHLALGNPHKFRCRNTLIKVGLGCTE